MSPIDLVIFLCYWDKGRDLFSSAFQFAKNNFDSIRTKKSIQFSRATL